MKISQAVQKLCHSADDWFYSSGSLGVTVKRNKGVWGITFFPSLRLKINGLHKKKVYSSFSISVNELAGIFDQLPLIKYDGKNMRIQGEINSEVFVVRILSKPPRGTPVFEEVRNSKTKYKLSTIDQAGK